MSTSVSSVVKHFPSAENGFTTTLSGSISSGAVTVGLNSVAGYTNGEVAVFVVDPTDAAKKQTFTGTIDTGGVQVTDVVWTAGTNQTHAAGATVVDYATATHISMMTKGLLVEHAQTGLHTLTSSATITSSKVITGLNDTNGNEIVKVSPTGSAVNEITVANAATTGKPTLSATGGDTNIDLALAGKGTGRVVTDYLPPQTFVDESTFDYVASGCVWSGDAYGSTRVASMTAGTVYINGRRISLSAVTSRTFTASKDTYVDVLDNADGTGTIVYTEATNNAASSALAANSIRIAIIVTGASNIANAGSVNQGQRDKALPIASSIPYSVTDSLGNLICSRDPNRKMLGYRQRITSFTATTEAQITELSCPVIVPAHRTVKLTIWSSRMSNDTSGNGALMRVWDGTVGSGTIVASASFDGAAVNNAGVPVCQSGFYTNATASAESKTFNGSLGRNGAGTATLLFTGFTSLYAWVLVELE